VVLELRSAVVRKMVLMLELAVYVLLGNGEAVLVMTSPNLWANLLAVYSLSEVMCMERTYSELEGRGMMVVMMVVMTTL
jgi:predicted CDP-diglyceride synthetase/phosphatidate cytidylyltransferase